MIQLGGRWGGLELDVTVAAGRVRVVVVDSPHPAAATRLARQQLARELQAALERAPRRGYLPEGELGVFLADAFPWLTLERPESEGARTPRGVRY